MSEWVQVGRIVGVFGVHGWVKVHSYTQPRENLLRYQPWWLNGLHGLEERTVLDSQAHGKGLVALLNGCPNPEKARLWVGCSISVPREVLPPTEEGEYYWTDLLGLEVWTLQNIRLGVISDWIETGANDVLVVVGDRERLIPYLPEQVVRKVDLIGKRVLVDWDPEF